MASFLDKIGLADVLTRIKNAFVAKADTQEVQFLDIDSTPTANSTNLVTSGGVAGALAGKQDTIDAQHKLDYGLLDNTPTIPVYAQTYQKQYHVFTANAGADGAGFGRSSSQEIMFEDDGDVRIHTSNTGKLRFNGQEVALVSAIPTVPTISTDIETDKASDAKTASPKAVADYVDGKTGDLTNLNTTSNNNLVAAINELKSNSSNTYTVSDFWSIPDSILEVLEVGDTVIQDLELIGGSGELLGTVVDCQDNYRAITSYDPANGYYLYEYSRSDSLEEWSCSASSFPLNTIVNKADKVSNATSGNLAGLDSYGNLTDSGHSASSFATSAQGTKADNAVQYIQQSLTDAQKTQARTNIGATAPEVFWVEYGTTTLQEVTNAYNAGKLVICKYQGKFYTLSTLTETYCYFTAVNNTAYYRLLLNGSNWSAGQGSLEVVGNKVTSLSSSSTDTQYPSAKLVYDSLAEKQDVIDANNKLDYSLIDNTPTIPIISTDIILDKTTDEKTVSPKAVWDVIENTALLDDTTTFSYEPVTVATTKNGVISQTQTWTGNSSSGYDYTMSNLIYGSIPQSNIDLFESVGAVFNETSGYFELNGLSDISYKEMLRIFSYANLDNAAKTVAGYFQGGFNCRTNISTWTGTWNQKLNCAQMLLGEAYLESFLYGGSTCVAGSCNWMFQQCNRLKKISELNMSDTTSASSMFSQCYSLEDVRIKGLKISIMFNECSRLNTSSIAYMINNAGTATITITLHPTAYDRAIANSDVQAALENKTNVTLASA